MVLTSQSSWRSSQGDFSDPETPVRMTFKMASVLLLAASIVSGLLLAIFSLALCGEGMSSSADVFY